MNAAARSRTPAHARQDTGPRGKGGVGGRWGSKAALRPLRRSVGTFPSRRSSWVRRKARHPVTNAAKVCLRAVSGDT